MVLWKAQWEALKACVHEECFPLLYKFVHQHPGSGSLFFLTPPDRIWQSRLLGVYTVNVTGQLLSRGPPASVQTFWKSSTVYTYLFHLFPPKQSKCKSRGNPSCETSTHTFQLCRAIGWRTSVKHQMSTFYSSINNLYHLYLWENKHVPIITLLLLLLK